MLDINFARENPERVKNTLKKKFKKDKISLVDDFLKKDKLWRKLKLETDNIRAERNKISLAISEAKKKKKSITLLIKQAKEIPEKLEKKEIRLRKVRNEVDNILFKLPNILHKDVPIGEDDSKNVEVKQIGKPKKFSFKLKSHQEIASTLGMADFESSADTSGNGFYFLEGDLALLNQALLRYALDFMVKKGFIYVETPYLLRKEIINNVVDLHDQENMIYKIEDEDLYLLGTSEHSLIGRYINKTLNDNDLPIKQTSYSMCFRREKGSHGLDERGLFRTHQFNKIEMIVICKPEESMKFFKELKQITIDIFKGLKLPIRELAICSGDLGDLKHIQYDIEAYSPRRKEYFEVGSCSNLTSAQSALLRIRTTGKFIPHTLNNTAIATSRALVAILENYQNKNGSVDIPKVLQPYMFGKKKLEKV